MQEKEQKNQCNFAISMGFYLLALGICIIGLSYWNSMEVPNWLKALFLTSYILHLAFSLFAGIALFGNKTNYDQNIYYVNVLFYIILCFWGLIILGMVTLIVYLLMQEGKEIIIYITYTLYTIFVLLAIIGLYCGITIPLRKLYSEQVLIFSYMGIQSTPEQNFAVFKH